MGYLVASFKGRTRFSPTNGWFHLKEQSFSFKETTPICIYILYNQVVYIH